MEGTPDINPTPNEEEISQPEAAPQTFEEMLEAAKALRLQGVDPFEYADYSESGNPELIRLRDNLQDWENAHDLAMDGIRTVEKAKDTIQSAMLWINAGYTDTDTVEKTLDYLAGEERSLATDIAPEIRQTISTATESLREMLRPEGRFESKLSEALQKIEEENYADAIPLLYALLKSKLYAKPLKKDSLRAAYIAEQMEIAKVKFRKQRGLE